MGTGAKEDGLRVELPPSIHDSSSPAEQLFTPQVPLRSVPGSYVGHRVNEKLLNVEQWSTPSPAGVNLTFVKLW
ncbi:hypothetical protein CesoFtcFv8_025544 [Champsocephalus esox]|uniref:Uncharacterized protein n=2 Tax=Champsocephalus TaxID=52236 RepID=A0AAN8C6Y1_CHAGU|nr:hypothetical protein CesoFtcFv8_025544 [Champsocephalus esox]KAK5898077.1 hypothetical protein CgunFtcFv8_015526 [Champsocephalus gunnari]